MFNKNEIDQFRSEGWVAKTEFWAKREVRAMRAELERLKAVGLLRNVATSSDKINLQLCPMFPHSRFYRAMPFADKAISAVRQLIGDPVILQLDQVFLKPGLQGMGTNWHQDNAYFQIEDPLKGTAMWTAVHDATIENGTIHVIPGSYRVAYEHSRDPHSSHHIRCYPPRRKLSPLSFRRAAWYFSPTAWRIARWPTPPTKNAQAWRCILSTARWMTWRAVASKGQAPLSDGGHGVRWVKRTRGCRLWHLGRRGRGGASALRRTSFWRNASISMRVGTSFRRANSCPLPIFPLAQQNLAQTDMSVREVISRLIGVTEMTLSVNSA